MTDTAHRARERLDWSSSPVDKDWLHLNVFDHEHGVVGLVNVSRHGPWHDERARAIGAALFHVPGNGWLGAVDVRDRGEAIFGSRSIALDRMAIAVTRDRHVHASARILHPDVDAVDIDVVATATSAAIELDRRVAFGRGWISWDAVPRLSLKGSLRVGATLIDATTASAYHDRNWGNWHWGDDVGWEWGIFHASGGNSSIVVARTTDRAHRHLGAAMLASRRGRARRIWRDGTVTMDWFGALIATLRRVPGPMAALHQDRARPRLPRGLVVTADDGIDCIQLVFTADAAAQIIAAEPVRRGYGFLHQLVGTYTATGRVGDDAIDENGLAVIEYVT